MLALSSVDIDRDPYLKWWGIATNLAPKFGLTVPVTPRVGHSEAVLYHVIQKTLYCEATQ